MGLILPRWGLTLPRTPPSTPVRYSAVTNPCWGFVCTQNNPSLIPKHPFSWPELESGQNELQSGQYGPQLGKMFEKWQVGKKKNSCEPTLRVLDFHILMAQVSPVD